MAARSARRSTFVALTAALLAAGMTEPSFAAGPGPAPQQSTPAHQPPSPAHQATKPAKDRTPPAPATDLRLAANDARSISLAWTNPADADFAGVLIRRSDSDTAPISAKDGVLVATLNARQAAFTDHGLAAGHSYSYSVFSRDRDRNVGVPVSLSTATRTRDTATGVRGKVTDAEGRAIKAVQVEIREASSGNYVAGAATSSTGQFLATGLSAGTYLVCFFVTSETTGHSATGYRPGCYRQQPYGYGTTGTPVVVRAGKITSGLVDYLPVAGGISGRVTDPAGHPIANVGVQIISSDPDHGSAAYTGPDGTYTATGLAADTYSVCFTGQGSTGASPTGYLDECYDDQPPYYTGTPVPVTLGHLSGGVNATLEVAGAITGRVTDGSGAPVANIGVSTYGAGWGYEYTDSTGAYTIKGLPTGTYYACFDGSYATSADAPYGYTNTCVTGTVIVDVTAGEAAALDGHVDVAGAVSGTVTGDDGPVAGVWVQVSDSSGGMSISTSTDENGNYLLTGLSPGEVTVCFDPTFTAGAYLRACYGDDTGSPAPVLISGGQLSTADIQLHHGASLTGTVTDAAGAPIGNVMIQAYDENYSYYSAVTDESGNYTLGGVAAGSYRICFDPSYASGPAAAGYAFECYDNQPSLDSADPVAVGTSGFVTVDAALSVGAAITGQVTGSDGAVLSGVYVYANAVDGSSYGVATTGYDGTYSVRNVSEGDYSLCFDAVNIRQPAATGYVNECFDDYAPNTGYTAVHVAAGTLTTGIDAELAVGAEMTGHVTDAAGNGIPYISVQATRADGSYLGYGYTDENGRYEMAGLPATEVTVCFLPDSTYQSECYDDQPDASTANPVSLSAGAVRSGVDAVLAEAPPTE